MISEITSTINQIIMAAKMIMVNADDISDNMKMLSLIQSILMP